MDSLDPLVLARIQFAFTISFHILFPAFTIGLASYLMVLEGLWLWTRREAFRDIYGFWIKIFAVSFGMGVVSGIVLSYQFGTNWSRWSWAVGPAIGPAIAYEVLTAFFLEAGFLGIMLFGWKRVGNGLHFLATCLVALGTLTSAFWILSANSWMHTPAGYEVVNGQFHATDWWLLIFNPSFPYRLAHMVLAAYLTTAFVVGAVGAWHLLRDGRDERARIMFSMAMWMAALVTPIQIVAGDLHGLNTLEHQPAKIAAMEGHFETEAPAPLILFGWPDMAAETTRWAVEIPYLGSLILRHDLSSSIQGLKEFPREDWPNATLIFWTFRVMVGLGLIMLAIGCVSLWLRWKDRLYDQPLFLRACILTGPIGFIALLCGWITTESGRQPWIVYGMMRTADGVSLTPGVSVAATLVLFVITYTIVFGAGSAYILRLMRSDLRSKPLDTTSDASGKRPLGGGTALTQAGGVIRMEIDLPLWCAAMIAIAVFMYVLLDGFDLGIGILFPFARSDADRDVMMNSVAPIWDGNETWLVLGGGGLLGFFPIAYAVLLEAFYLPLIVMLLGLIYRGISFEFRFKSRRNKHWWDRSFAFGSMMATFCQGVVLGTFIQGTEVIDRQYAGGAFGWLNPFSVFCGLALMIGYAALGAGWIVAKTEGDLQQWARTKIRPLLIGMLVAFGLVSLWTPFVHDEVAGRWFSFPNIIYLSPVPILTALCAWLLWQSAPKSSDHKPFLLTLGLFTLAYLGLGISLFPYIIPPAIDIWEAAGPPKSQAFMLIGVLILVPVILIYNAYSYWVFRGKVTVDAGYH